MNDNPNPQRLRFNLVNPYFAKIWKSNPYGIDPRFQRFVANIYTAVRNNNDMYICVAGRERRGKCIFPDTEIVYIKDNRLEVDEIQNVYGKSNLETLSVNPSTLKVEIKKITDVVRYKYDDDIIDIELNSGRKLNGTTYHSFIVFDDINSFRVVKGEDLKEGMLIPTLKHIDLSDNLISINHNILPKRNNSLTYKKENFDLTVNFGFLIGAYLSEGNASKNYCITITNEDKNFLDKVINSCKELGIHYGITNKEGTNAKSLHIHSVILTKFIKNEFGQLANKRVAPFVFFSNDSFKRGLIDGYFAGDGTVCHSKRKKSNGKIVMDNDVSFTSKSRHLRDSMSLLLNEYGIITTHRIKKNNVYGNYYVANIVFGDYIKLLGLLSDSKYEKLRQIISYPKTRTSDVYNRIPMTRYQLKCLSLGQKYLKRGTETRSMHSCLRVNINRCGGIGFKMFEDYMSMLNNGTPTSELLMKMYNSDIFFDKIKKVTRTKCNDYVYDLCVEDNNNFMLANGCFVHNSNCANTLGFLLDPAYSLQNNVLYQPNKTDIINKMRWNKAIAIGEKPHPDALPPYSVINVDEAIRVMYKLEQWSNIQRFLKKLFALAGSENKIMIFCIPEFLDLGSGFRNRMDYWIHMESRTLATVEMKSTNKWSSDKWDTDINKKNYEYEMAKMGKRYYAQLNPKLNEMINQRCSRNYVTSFNVARLPEEIDSEYNRLKSLHDYEEAGLDEKKESVSERTKKFIDERNKLYSLLKERTGLDDREIAEYAGVKPSAVCKWKKVVHPDNV